MKSLIACFILENGNYVEVPVSAVIENGRYKKEFEGRFFYPFDQYLLEMSQEDRRFFYRGREVMKEMVWQPNHTHSKKSHVEVVSLDELMDNIHDGNMHADMPIKIHLGIDSAIEKMLQCHELVWEDDCYRLPADEDRKKWREQWLAEWGAKISFEDLKKIFALDLKELEESIDIEFSLGEHDGLWIGKTADTISGADIFWVSADTGEHCDFSTFREMVEANLFDGKNLKSVWGDVTLTFISDHDMSLWLDEHLS